MIELALAALVGTAAPACLRDGDRIEGEFRYVETRHHGQQIRQAFVVTEEPFCFAPVIWTSAPQVRGRWIQVHWSDESTPDPNPGDVVAMMVAGCNEPGTTWHIGDIVCDARLVSRETM